ncbi:MAG: aminotransferase class V-fold PLP-dependent enzyme [Bryobacterales bacterium]|nr:aminotransferase class V-fold PLP-dependent enzyme [Bryobacterales bacterium]
MCNRRSFIDLIASVPGLGLLAGIAGAAPRAKLPARDYFRELGVTPFINAAGTYTALTASVMPLEVRDAWQYATSHYVKLTKLQDAVGARIAELTGAEAAMVTSGAAGALTVGTAGILTGTDPEKIRRLPDTSGMRNEVLIQKSHRFAYDHAVRSTGVTMVELETPEDVARLAGDRTAMMLFFNDANDRGRIKDAEWVRLAKRHGVPTFIDCAADVPPVENLSKYLKMGFDLVTFSGGKGLMGPQSAGLLLGREDLIEAARLNTSPFSDSLARGMKVNKEEMLAMMVAVESYLKRDHAADLREWNRRCDVIANAARQVKTVTSEVIVPPIANHVPHLVLRWDTSSIKLTPIEAMQRLADGEPSIEACPLTDRERLVFGVWMMQPGDAERVARRVREVLKEAI